MTDDRVEDILGELCRRAYQAKGTDSYISLVDQAKHELISWVRSHRPLDEHQSDLLDDLCDEIDPNYRAKPKEEGR